MADLTYCGTLPIDADRTQALLGGPFAAVWSPPMWRYASAAGGDRLWLLWSESTSKPPLLLGVGNVIATEDGQVAWTNRTAPGIVEVAREQGIQVQPTWHSYGSKPFEYSRKGP
jgi:hypothetical protein